MTSGVTRKEGDILGDYRLGHVVSEGAVHAHMGRRAALDAEACYDRDVA